MLGYAEIHYRPRFIPSLIYRSWPEIVCDAPGRVEPGQPLSVFLIIRDAHRFPVSLEVVAVHMSYENGRERVAHFPFGGIPIDRPVWWDSFNIVPECYGTVRISVHVLVKKGKRLREVRIDNYPGSSRSPFGTSRCRQ